VKPMHRRRKSETNARCGETYFQCELLKRMLSRTRSFLALNDSRARIGALMVKGDCVRLNLTSISTLVGKLLMTRFLRRLATLMAGPYRRISAPLIYHLEYICSVERNAPAPLQNKMHFVGLGPRRKPNGRPYAGHREDNRPPRLTFAPQFQRGMVVAANRQMASISTGNRRMGAKELTALLFSCTRA